MPYLSLLKYGLPFLAGVGAMWLYHSAVVSGIREDVAQERQEYAEQSQAVAVKAQKEVAKVEQYFYEKMQADIAAVDAREPERVFIRARCPGLPVSGDTSVDDGSRAELSAASKRLVSELRRRVVRLESKLAAWQALKSPQ